MNDFVYNMFTEYIKSQVGDDQALLAKVIPDYAPMGKRTLQAGSKALECKPERFDDYYRRYRELHAQLIWEHDSITTSYYQNSEGKVTLLWPWKILDMWRLTKECNPDDYLFHR